MAILAARFAQLGFDEDRDLSAQRSARFLCQTVDLAEDVVGEVNASEPYNQPIKIFGEAKAPRRRRPKNLRAEIIELVRRLKKLQAEARHLGLFAEDRELLSCPNCGLEEDVAIDGRLLVTAEGNRRCDTGLRFARVTKRGGWWRCPNCKSVVKEPGAP